MMMMRRMRRRRNGFCPHIIISIAKQKLIKGMLTMLSVLVNTFRVLSSPAMIVGGSAGGTTVDDADIDRLPKRMGWTVRRRKYEELMMKDFFTFASGREKCPSASSEVIFSR